MDHHGSVSTESSFGSESVTGLKLLRCAILDIPAGCVDRVTKYIADHEALSGVGLSLRRREGTLHSLKIFHPDQELQSDAVRRIRDLLATIRNETKKKTIIVHEIDNVILLNLTEDPIDNLRDACRLKPFCSAVLQLNRVTEPRSLQMHGLRHALSRENVLLLGPGGTGKQIITALLAADRSRSGSVFVVVASERRKRLLEDSLPDIIKVGGDPRTARVIICDIRALLARISEISLKLIIFDRLDLFVRKAQGLDILRCKDRISRGVQIVATSRHMSETTLYLAEKLKLSSVAGVPCPVVEPQVQDLFLYLRKIDESRLHLVIRVLLNEVRDDKKRVLVFLNKKHGPSKIEDILRAYDNMESMRLMEKIRRVEYDVAQANLENSIKGVYLVTSKNLDSLADIGKVDLIVNAKLDGSLKNWTIQQNLLNANGRRITVSKPNDCRRLSYELLSVIHERISDQVESDDRRFREDAETLLNHVTNFRATRQSILDDLMAPM